MLVINPNLEKSTFFNQRCTVQIGQEKLESVRYHTGISLFFRRLFGLVVEVKDSNHKIYWLNKSSICKHYHEKDKDPALSDDQILGMLKEVKRAKETSPRRATIPGVQSQNSNKPRLSIQTTIKSQSHEMDETEEYTDDIESILADSWIEETLYALKDTQDKSPAVQEEIKVAHDEFRAVQEEIRAAQEEIRASQEGITFFTDALKHYILTDEERADFENTKKRLQNVLAISMNDLKPLQKKAMAAKSRLILTKKMI